jgi:hypothetical protein
VPRLFFLAPLRHPIRDRAANDDYRDNPRVIEQTGGEPSIHG